MGFYTMIRNASKRVPLIAFRKGGLGEATRAAAPAQSSTSKLASSQKSSKKQSKGAAIEDWELHPRYRRKPIDEKEMAYINCGGPV